MKYSIEVLPFHSAHIACKYSWNQDSWWNITSGITIPLFTYSMQKSLRPRFQMEYSICALPFHSTRIACKYPWDHDSIWNIRSEHYHSTTYIKHAKIIETKIPDGIFHLCITILLYAYSMQIALIPRFPMKYSIWVLPSHSSHIACKYHWNQYFR